MKYVKAKSGTLTNEVQQLKRENKCEFCQNFFYSKNLLKTHMKREHEQNLRHELFNIKKNLMEKKDEAREENTSSKHGNYNIPSFRSLIY